MGLTKKTAIPGKGIEHNGLITYVAKGAPGFSDHTPLFQSGTCKPCNIHLKSWSKRATCPRCGNPVFLS
jgi:hypothetical protein